MLLEELLPKLSSGRLLDEFTRSLTRFLNDSVQNQLLFYL